MTETKAQCHAQLFKRLLVLITASRGRPLAEPPSGAEWARIRATASELAPLEPQARRRKARDILLDKILRLPAGGPSASLWDDIQRRALDLEAEELDGPEWFAKDERRGAKATRDSSRPLIYELVYKARESGKSWDEAYDHAARAVGGSTEEIRTDYLAEHKRIAEKRRRDEAKKRRAE